MRIVFSGSIGRLPVGGHAWVDMQYLIGLRELGHDVYYLEECGEESWVYHWRDEVMTTDLAYPTDYVRTCLEPIGFSDRWIYRAGNESCGMSDEDFDTVCATADLLLIRAVALPLWRPAYLLPRRCAYIDMDPLFTQIKLANGHNELAETVARSDALFTIGLTVGTNRSSVPTCGKHWHKTYPAIALSHWPDVSERPAADFTTVMQWRSYADVTFEGRTYGNKNREFGAFADLPVRTPQPFRIALTGGPAEDLSGHGWQVVEGWEASETIDGYQWFVQDSRAEFSVAKHGYVASQCGWISDRTVCYLASGRPALVQDTGLGDSVPVGRGLLVFRDMDEAVRGVEEINGDYGVHCRAARAFAEEYCATERVLVPLLERAAG